jgi:7,8-dihydropterin-6-yl-methyl-4-(beta-D-ribofuranosyl)aminobenzene 5'-phosphate synthase
MKKFPFLILLLGSYMVLRAQAPRHEVGHFKITILSTMLAQEGVGDWGFGALIECDSNRILFDTGGRPFVVRDNAKDLQIDLSNVPVVVLSQGHPDHTAGWRILRDELAVTNRNALAITYVAPGCFAPVVFASGGKYDLRADSGAYVASGGRVKTVKTWSEISPGVFLTGNDVPRIYPERNYPAALKRENDKGQVIRDTIPEDMSMVILTQQGLVIITGCGHSGTVNLLAAVRKHFPDQKIYAAIGGFHLLAANDQQIEWTARALKDAGVRYFMGAHCTGILPVQQIMTIAGLKRNECIVGSVGATFDPSIGFIAGQLTMGPDKNAYFKK